MGSCEFKFRYLFSLYYIPTLMFYSIFFKQYFAISKKLFTQKYQISRLMLICFIVNQASISSLICENKMNHQTEIWKAINSSKRIKTRSNSHSRSKSRKYSPRRELNESNLSRNLRVINQSKLQASSLYEAKQLAQAKSNVPKVENSLENNKRLSLHLKNIPMIDLKQFSQNEEPLSPDIDLKLSKIQKQLNRQKKEKQVHFSLDAEHRYLHRQIERIKEQFINFKRFIMIEINRQEELIRAISKQMREKVEQFKFLKIDGIKENQFHFPHRQEINPMLIDQLSSINQDTNSLTNSKIELNKFGWGSAERQNQSNTLRGTNNNMFTTKMNRKDLVRSEIFNQRNNSAEKDKICPKQQKQDKKQDRKEKDFSRGGQIQIQGFEEKQILRKSADKRQLICSDLGKGGKERTTTTSREESKRQFSKLFEAVRCLKNDLKGLTDATQKMYRPGAQTERKKYSQQKSPNISHYDPYHEFNEKLALNPLNTKDFTKSKSSITANENGTPSSTQAYSALGLKKFSDHLID